MSTFIVWVLIVTNSYYGNHRVVVDNISSERNCRGLGNVIVGTGPDEFVCVPVRKVAVK